MPHAIAAQVLAFPCFAIFCSYDANAPDTKDIIVVSTEDLAKEVCDLLNEDPRAHSQLAYVEGYEHCKRFEYRSTLRTDSREIRISLAHVVAQLLENEEDEDGCSNGCDGDCGCDG
jgi:hypothetical protein